MRQVFDDRSVLFLGCDPAHTEYKNFFKKFAVNAKVMYPNLSILNSLSCSLLLRTLMASCLVPSDLAISELRQASFWKRVLVPILSYENDILFSCKLNSLSRRQRGRVVRVSDSQSGGPGLESHSGHYLDLFLGSPEFKSSDTLVNSQLVCLRPVGILNNVTFNLNYLFQLFARPH